tara:strand:+ start:2830 stop:4266 length:1437 start_codon:yes stop_codon:yes gene_type:complete
MSKEEKLSQIKKKFDKALIKSAEEVGVADSFEDLKNLVSGKGKDYESKISHIRGVLSEKLESDMKTSDGKFSKNRKKLADKALKGKLTGNNLDINKSSKTEKTIESFKSFGEKFHSKTGSHVNIRGKKFKYTDITFYLVIFYIFISLLLDSNHWFTFSPDNDNAMYIFVGFIISLFTNKELGSPIRIMRKIMIDLMGEDYKYGFSYFIEKIWIPLFGGLRKGSNVFALVFSWPFAKLILYIPLLVITFFQYIIPVVITIILIPITLVVGLVTGAVSEGGGAIVSVDAGEISDKAAEEADMFIASALKKIWRTINKIIPFKKLVAVYIIGMIFYTILLPLLVKVYMTFAIVIIIHIIFNKLLIEALLNSLLIRITKYNILKVISYVIIMGLYYYIQFEINLSFIFKDQDPVYTIMIDILGFRDLAPWKTPIHLKKNTLDLLCPNPVPQKQVDEWPHPHFKRCMYILITFTIISFLSRLS